MARTIQKKEVCRCENCGNEAEMVFTCTLPELDSDATDEQSQKVKGSATCSRCGNEADMWIDY